MSLGFMSLGFLSLGFLSLLQDRIGLGRADLVMQIFVDQNNRCGAATGQALHKLHRELAIGGGLRRMGVGIEPKPGAESLPQLGASGQ